VHLKNHDQASMVAERLSAGDVWTCGPAFATRNQSVGDAAGLMREHHVDAMASSKPCAAVWLPSIGMAIFS
jgi:hypothetical protein